MQKSFCNVCSPRLTHCFPENLSVLRIGCEAGDRSRSWEWSPIFKNWGKTETRDRSGADWRVIASAAAVYLKTIILELPCSFQNSLDKERPFCRETWVILFTSCFQFDWIGFKCYFCALRNQSKCESLYFQLPVSKLKEKGFIYENSIKRQLLTNLITELSDKHILEFKKSLEGFSRLLSSL